MSVDNVYSLSANEPELFALASMFDDLSRYDTPEELEGFAERVKQRRDIIIEQAMRRVDEGL